VQGRKTREAGRETGLKGNHDPDNRGGPQGRLALTSGGRARDRIAERGSPFGTPP
jgi:hypothetical protein